MNKKGQEASFKSLISQNLKQYGMIGALVALVVFFQISTNGSVERLRTHTDLCHESYGIRHRQCLFT